MNINSHIQLPNCVYGIFGMKQIRRRKSGIWMCRQAIFCASLPKNSEHAKGYYSETGERFWAENIENPLSIISRKIQKTVQVKYRACRFLLMTQMYANVISRLRLSEAKWRRMK